MKSGRWGTRAAAAVVLGWPAWVWSCEYCVGKVDNPQTAGMTQAIWGMLVITGGVLACVAGFFVTLWRRSRHPLDAPAQVLTRLEREFQKEEEIAV